MNRGLGVYLAGTRGGSGHGAGRTLRLAVDTSAIVPVIGGRVGILREALGRQV